jgi:hypothetical protein
MHVRIPCASARRGDRPGFARRRVTAVCDPRVAGGSALRPGYLQLTDRTWPSLPGIGWT